MPASPLFTYTLRLADNALVLGHRLSEWCGHAPLLEEDLALANMGLDLIGQARSFYQYAGVIEGMVLGENQGRDEDQLAYLRDAPDWLNFLIHERPKGDFAFTILRQFLVAAYLHPFYTQLCQSSDETLAAIAAKGFKEIAYHLRHASEWVIRLGDGTEESATRLQDALLDLWPFTGEMFEVDVEDRVLIEAGIAVDPARIRVIWDETIDHVFAEAMLKRPQSSWMQTGGRRGEHSEHLGHLLTDLQFMQRSYPNMVW